MRLVAAVLLSLLLGVAASAAPSWGQGKSGSNPNAHSGHGREDVVIQGETVGFVSVSPALEKAIEAAQGKKHNPDPGAMGPNAEVRSDGFTYVSPAAKGKKK